jgi:hypothetical protein
MDVDVAGAVVDGAEFDGEAAGEPVEHAATQVSRHAAVMIPHEIRMPGR